jgi:hypothetical protein
MMGAIKLEIIDLSTGKLWGSPLQLDLCVPQTLELYVGDYRFRATYLATGEVQEVDRNISEGENPPLDFFFTAVIRDDFNDGVLNTAIWRVFRGGNVYERNGRVEVEPVEVAAGIRLRNRVNLKDFDLRIQRDPRGLEYNNWNQVTIGDSPTAVDIDWGCLTWSTDGYFYTVIFRWEWKLIHIFRSFLGAETEIYSGDWNQRCGVLRVRIEPHPAYPGEDRWLIRFYDDEKELVSEECTDFIRNLNGLGVIELFSRLGLCAWDNFSIYPSSQPEPTLHTITVQELSNGNGIVFPEAGVYAYPEGSMISMVAIPKSGFKFNGWIIDGVEYSEPFIILKLTKDFTVQSKGFSILAGYAVLTIESTPINVDFNIDTNKAKTPYSEALPMGTYTVTMPQYILGGVTYKFVHWEDGSTNPTRIINLTGDLKISATYQVVSTHRLTVLSTPIDGIEFTIKKA